MDDPVTIEGLYMGYVDLHSSNKEFRPNLSNARAAHKKLATMKFKRGSTKPPPAFLDGYDTTIVLIV